mgnify:FL=1
MPDIWYIGKYSYRTITAADWSLLGISGPEVTWNHTNGWSVPDSLFTAPQLAVLAGYSDFAVGQSGPRTSVSPVSPQDNYGSAYIYAKAAKDLYEAVFGSIGQYARTFMQQIDPDITNPEYTGKALWIQTDDSGTIVDMKVRT